MGLHAQPYTGADFRFAPYVVRSWDNSDLDFDEVLPSPPVPALSSSSPSSPAAMPTELQEEFRLSRGAYTRSAPPYVGAEFRFAPYDVRS